MIPFKRILILNILVIVSSLFFSQDVTHKHFNEKNGLPSSLVYGFRQDNEGFIWLMTDKGLARYNGIGFDIYNIQNGLSDNDVFNLYIDSKNNKWPVSHSKILKYLDKNNSPIKIIDSLGSDYLIYENDENNVIVNDGSKNYTYINNIIINKKADYRVEALFSEKYAILSRNSSLFIANKTNDSIIYKIPSTWGIHITKDITNSPQFFYSIKTKHLYTINNNLRIDSALISIPGDIDRNNFSFTSSLPYIFITLNGYIHVLNYKGEKINQLEKNINSLIDNPIKVWCFSDKNKNLWVSDLKNGAYFVPNFKSVTDFFMDISKKNQLGDIKGIHTLNSDTYIHTLYKIYKVDKKTNSLLEIYTSDESINDVFIINNNFIGVIKYYSLDIISVNGNSDFKKIIPPKKINLNKGQNYTVNIAGGKSITFSRGSFYIGQYGRVLKIQPNKDSLYFSEIKHSSYIIHKYFPLDSNKDLILTRDNLFISNSTEIKAINTRDLSVNSFSSIIKFNKDILLSTRGLGIYKLNEKEFLLEKITSFKNKNVIKMETHNNNLWVLTEKGIYRGEKKLANFNFQLVISNKMNVINDKIKDFSLDSNSIKLITSNNIIEFNFKYFDSIFGTKNVFIRSVISDSIITPNDQNIYNVSKNVSIIVDALTINNVYNSYMYKLEGIDKDWESTTKKNINYRNLPYGKYEFKIKISTLNGESETKSLFIQVLPPFWKSLTGIFILIVFSIVVVAYLTFLFVSAYFAKKEQKKEDLYNNSMLQFKALQNRMNPHFIFNALDSFQGALFKGERKTANTFLIHFSSLLRQFIDYSEKNFIELDEELTLIDNYLQVEMIKHLNKFDYKITVDNQVKPNKLKVPTFLLQPIIENAIEHGVRPLRDKKGLVLINVYYVDNNLIIDIIDNGNGIDLTKNQKSNTKSRAMKIIEQKIELINKNNLNKISFIISSNTLSGTLAKYSIPLDICLEQ